MLARILCAPRAVPASPLSRRAPRHYSRFGFGLVLLWATALSSEAVANQAPATAEGKASHAPSGVVDIGIERHSVDEGLGDWRGNYLRGVWFKSPGTVVHYELVDTRRFNAKGRFGSLGLTRTLDDRWYVSGSAGAGGGAFFFPDWRIDVAINRKWLDDRSLVTTIGYTQYNAPDGHVDRTALFGVTWYAPRQWVLEAGLRPNRSSPGAVASNSGYVAATWGEDGMQYMTLRHERGREAYQSIGENTLLVDIPSRVSSVAWRRWLTPRCGFNVRLEHYVNPNYRRSGGEAGGFCGF